MFDLGKHLAALRTRRGLSQLALAQMIGVTKQSISQFESGRALPNIETAGKLATVLGTSLDNLGGLTSATTLSLSDEDTEFLSVFLSLPLEIQEFLRTCVRTGALLYQQRSSEVPNA